MSYQRGEFCWVDLSAKSAEAAMRFYGEVFGWKATDTGVAGHPYWMFTLEGKLVAGLGEMPAGMEAPVHWNTYIASADVEADVAKATELGAALMFPPQKGGESGWFAYLTDPEGAVFALWQAADGSEPAVRGIPGTSSWNELNTRDREAAQGFYGALFGWSFETVESGAGRRYTRIAAGDEAIGGIIVMDESWGEAPAHFITYFASEDVDATHARVLAAGGSSCVAPFDLPAGRFAMVNDTEGAVFAIIKRNETALDSNAV